MILEPEVLQIFILLGSLVVLVKSSDIVSDSGANLSRITGLGEMAVGFLLLSIVTSLPELAVSMFAVNSGDVGISIGTLFGSNIANLGIVLGLTAILTPRAFVASQRSHRGISLMMLASSIVPLVALILTNLGHFVGVLLILMFVGFCIQSIRGNVTIKEGANRGELHRAKEVALFLGGIAAVIISARLVVSSSVFISTALGLDDAIIGGTVIAAGTSLPEVSVSLAAARHGHMDLALGNILGSCVTNLTLILGTVLVLSTIKVSVAVFAELISMLLLLNVFVWRMLLDNVISLVDGTILMLMYAIFLSSTFGLQIAILSPQSLSVDLHEIMLALFRASAYGIVAIVAIALGVDLTQGALNDARRRMDQ